MIDEPNYPGTEMGIPVGIYYFLVAIWWENGMHKCSLCCKLDYPGTYCFPPCKKYVACHFAFHGSQLYDHRKTSGSQRIHHPWIFFCAIEKLMHLPVGMLVLVSIRNHVVNTRKEKIEVLVPQNRNGPLTTKHISWG